MLAAVRATHEHLDLGVLDALTVDAPRLPEVIGQILAERQDPSPVLDGWVVVATCNRLEIYLDTHLFHEGLDVVVEAVSRTSGMQRDLVALCFETAMDAPVPRHLFEVTAGLASLVMGEAEVVGQVRDGFESARVAGRTTTMLNDLFQLAFRTAKRVATKAPVGAAGRSGAAVAVDRAEVLLGGLEDRSVLIIGTGAYARLGVSDLVRRGVRDVRVHSASGRAAHFAQRHGVQAVPEGGLDAALCEADLVLACSGRGTSLFPEQLLQAGPTLILDLALHSDLHPLLRHLQHIRVMSLADLAAQLDDVSESAVLTAQGIVGEGVEEFRSRQQVRRVDPAMAAMRRAVSQSADAEVARLRREMSDEAAEQVERSVRRILAKVMHSPAARARSLAESGYADEYVDAFHTIFGIDVSAHREGEQDGEEVAPDGWMRLDQTVPPRDLASPSGPISLQDMARIARAGGGCPVDHGMAVDPGMPVDHGMGASR